MLGSVIGKRIRVVVDASGGFAGGIGEEGGVVFWEGRRFGGFDRSQTKGGLGFIWWAGEMGQKNKKRDGICLVFGFGLVD